VPRGGAGSSRVDGIGVARVGRLEGGRLAVVAVLLVAAGWSCSSTDDESGATAPLVTLPSEQDCRAAAREAVGPAQAFIDEHEALTVEQWNALQPPPDIAAVQREVQQRAQEVIGRGCVPAVVEDAVLDAIAALSGDGAVGAAIAGALKGETSAATQRESTASNVTVAPGDDVAAILARVGGGSTVTFAAGSYELTTTVVVDVSLEIVGAGRAATTISSSAPSVALAFVGPGELLVRDLALRHTGDEPASVVLAIVGGVTLRDVEVGGGSGIEQGGAGHGVVFAFEDLPVFPARTPEQRAGPLVVERTTITGNESAGILVSGDAAPIISGSTISGNGTCGVCYTDAAAGSLETSTVEDNGRIGVQVSGASHPGVTGSTVRRNPVGVFLTDTVIAHVSPTVFDANAVAIQLGGSAQLTATANAVPSADQVAVSLGETATATIRENRIAGGGSVGIDVGASAAATIVGNTIEGAGDVGVSFGSSSSGTVDQNTITGRRVGIQVAGTAHPDLTTNEVRGGEVGIAYFDGAAGSASDNRILEHGVGIQLTGTAAPRLATNELDGIERAAILYAETSAGEATGNRCRGPGGVGIALAPTATPTLDGNECPVTQGR
jgi:parallel beta-helix repeat protein